MDDDVGLIDFELKEFENFYEGVKYRNAFEYYESVIGDLRNSNLNLQESLRNIIQGSNLSEKTIEEHMIGEPEKCERVLYDIFCYVQEKNIWLS